MKETQNSHNHEFLQDETLSKKLLQKGFWLYFFAYLIWPIGYLIRIILSNDLSVWEVGLIYSIISFVSLLSIYNGLGLTESLRYFIPKFYIKKQFDFIKTTLSSALIVQMLTSVLIIAILRFWWWWLADHYFHSPDAEIVLKYFCLYFLWINLFQILQTVFISFQDTFSNKVIDFMKMVGILCFTLILFFTGNGSIMSYSIAWVVWLIVWILLWVFIFFKKYSFIITQWKITNDKKMMKTFLKYSAWTFVAMNAGVLMGAIDQQMVIVILGPESAGYFTNYQSLLNIMSVLIWPIMGLMFPLFTELFEKKQTDKIVLLRSFLYNYLGVFAVSLSLFLVALWPEIAVTLFGEKFLKSGELLSVWAGFYILQLLFSVSFLMLAAMWKVKQRTYIMLVAIVFNIVLNLILLQTIWVVGAIIATVVSWIVMLVLSMRILDKKYNAKLEYSFIFKNLALFVVLWMIIFILKDNFLVLDNDYRYVNFITLAVTWLVFYWIIAGFNYKKFAFLKKEIKNLRK